MIDEHFESLKKSDMGLHRFDVFDIILVLFFLCSFGIQTEAQDDPTYRYNFCSDNSVFSPNSTYQRNLNTLLSSLSSNTSDYVGGFANSTVGEASSERVNGLFLCRADVSAATCRHCVVFATQDILQKCPVQKVSIIWYDECLLSYSNESIFSIVREGPRVILYNTANVSETTRFTSLLGQMLADLKPKAANGQSGKKVAVDRANFTDLQTLYTFAQCTPDLIPSECSRCLEVVIASLPTYPQGARVLGPSCNVRYETYRFYNETAIALLSPPPSPPPVDVPPPSPSLVPPPVGESKMSTAAIIAIMAAVIAAVVFIFLGWWLLRRRETKKHEVTEEARVGSEIITVESLQFDFGVLQAATNNFSDANKLGEGGFGVVYKGVLRDGQEIALKRLSRNSGQGADEFKMEVMVVVKLQHRNLARLLGFCLEGEEKILVYEYVPNKSLDYFLFDPQKRGLLDWSRRYKIISGIARGMLYLHEDSLLRIIHRDLKSSNILLDGDMNPKISDFGMAKIFGVDQSQGTTNRVVGTYGYMSPEYAMNGQFSVKSDVYSFGILVLEIIAGQKNSSFYDSSRAEDLPSYAWRNWRDETPMELVDPIIRDSCSRNEVIRCIHMSLLCVQEDPADRPTMANIALILNSYSVTLAAPQQPAFFIRSRTELSKSDKSSSKSAAPSINEMSISEINPR